MKSAIKRLIESIQEEKKNTDPCLATRRELIREMDKALKELEKDGEVKIGDTMNDKYYKIIEKCVEQF